MIPYELVIGAVILCLIAWIYYLQYHRIKTEYAIFAEDLINHNFLKTGDLILFKAYNNFNSVFHGSYFGHVGVVYVKNGELLLFEANGLEHTPLKPHHPKTGVFLTQLIPRLQKYKGRCFWKPLNKPIEPSIIQEFDEFVNYALDNLKYDYRLLYGALRRMFKLDRCHKGTDCGQITFLSLIKLRLLHIDEYDNPRAHYLKYVCNVTELENDYKYLPIVEIIDHPFDS